MGPDALASNTTAQHSAWPPARVRLCRTGLAMVALLGTGVLVAGCGEGASGQGVASLGTTTTTAGPSPANGGSAASRQSSALAYISCMRTHGEPNMPDPSIQGDNVHISVSGGSAVDPNSPQFAAANNACKNLLPSNGGPTGDTITPADQADYLKGSACMRSHGIAGFPDPVFQGNNVSFNAPGSSIDTSSSQYKSALATCERLIPAGLPYSSNGGS